MTLCWQGLLGKGHRTSIVWTTADNVGAICKMTLSQRNLSTFHQQYRQQNANVDSMNHWYLGALFVCSTVKAANRKFISFMSFGIIAFIYRAFQVWVVWHYLTNVARIKSTYWGWPILFIKCPCTFAIYKPHQCTFINKYVLYYLVEKFSMLYMYRIL